MGAKYRPKHSAASQPVVIAPPRPVAPQSAKHAAVSTKHFFPIAAVAVVATGATVTGGLLNTEKLDQTEVDLAKQQLAAVDLAERTDLPVSRSQERKVKDPLKVASLRVDNGAATKVNTENLKPADPRELAKLLMPQYGLSAAEFDCLDRIWTQESRWNVYADNPYSSAYGIPQALPGSKMASFGADWATNPETQIRWGLNYIHDRYGTACNAWGFKAGHGWY